MALHLNIEDLLSARTVESDRIEFKEGWNPDAIYRSIGAFVNDFDNTGGGYLLIGVAENPQTKVAVRPVKGLTTKEIGDIQQDMIGFNNLIKPYYAPKISIETVDDQQIIVLWVVAGSERPYEVPESVLAKNKNWKYFIRKYASSIEAKGADKDELISLSNNIPFDDRANSNATIRDISMVLLQDYLRRIKSKLADELTNLTSEEVLQQMALLSGPREFIFPRNVGLMMFAEDPSRFFPSTQVDLVHFPQGEAASFTEYPKSIGPIPEQIRSTLAFLKMNFLKERVIKPRDRAESIRIWNYPIQAIEETLVNCFYHRDYQVREPIEIRIYANSIIFLNYGGPDRSIQIKAFQTGKVRPRRYRNRRLGDFLKELEFTEGRATGIPTIFKALKDNGSPLPRFNTDDDRSFFEVELFVHPVFNQLTLSDVEVYALQKSKVAIDQLLDRILEQAGIVLKDLESNLVSTVVKNAQDSDNNVIGIPDRSGSTIAGTIVEDLVNADNNIIGIPDRSGSTIAGTIVEDLVNADNNIIRIPDRSGSTLAGTIVEFTEHSEHFVDEIINRIDAIIADAISNAIGGVLSNRELKLMLTAQQQVNREMLLASIKLQNLRKSYDEYVKPLIALNWLSMSLPGKPTSPKQQYITTLKGRLILKFLNIK